MQSPGPEIEDSFDFLFKIILVGDSNVGKTCVVQSFKSGIFMEKQQNTIGVDFTVRTLDIDGKKVKVGDVNSIFNSLHCHFFSVPLSSVFIIHVPPAWISVPCIRNNFIWLLICFHVLTKTRPREMCLCTYSCFNVNNPLLVLVSVFFPFRGRGVAKDIINVLAFWVC